MFEPLLVAVAEEMALEGSRSIVDKMRVEFCCFVTFLLLLRVVSKKCCFGFLRRRSRCEDTLAHLNIVLYTGIYTYIIQISGAITPAS